MRFVLYAALMVMVAVAACSDQKLHSVVYDFMFKFIAADNRVNAVALAAFEQQKLNNA